VPHTTGDVYVWHCQSTYHVANLEGYDEELIWGVGSHAVEMASGDFAVCLSVHFDSVVRLELGKIVDLARDRDMRLQEHQVDGRKSTDEDGKLQQGSWASKYRV